MLRAFFAILFISLLLGACTQRMICPAYQSAFIYDQDELRKKFSYFQEDSTPKIFAASKNKYLVAEPTSYRKKLRSLQTVAMKPVNVHVPDSLQPGFSEEGIIAGAELDLAARSVIDSIYIEDVEQDTLVTGDDSVYVISKDKEIRLLKYNFPDSLVYDPNTGKYTSETPYYEVTEVTFNVEQDNYMWYLRDYLVLPDVRLSKMAGEEHAKAVKAGAAKKKEKKGIKGFFANLFKKKNKKAASDSTNVKPPPNNEDEFDYIDSTETQPKSSATDVGDQPTEKKGAFSFLKKKKKSADVGAPPPEEEKPAKKKKEKKSKDEPAPADAEKKDDGF